MARQGCVVPYRTLHRFATERCGFGRKDTTVRVVDGDPGSECLIDFDYLGCLVDPESGRRRKVHALIFTAVYSRHMFVWLTYSQTLAAVIAGCEAAWTFLKLGALKDTLPERLAPTRQHRLSHVAFLELLLADEGSRRESRLAGL